MINNIESKRESQDIDLYGSTICLHYKEYNYILVLIIQGYNITYIYIYIYRENYIYPPEVSTHFHFYLQSLICDTLPSKLSNCGNLTNLAYLFPKRPHLIFFFLKKNPKNMLGWPNHPIGGGRPPHLAWGGSTTPRPAGMGAAEPPSGPLGVVRPPPQKFNM
jgi:hypothetical protein